MRIPGAGRVSTDRHDRGSGSVLLLAVIVLTVSMALTLAALVRVQAARSDARAAADLAALGAAGSLALPRGVELATGVTLDTESACVLAGEICERNSARLTSCGVGEDGRGIVTVDVALGTIWGQVTASAVAGPVSERSGSP